MFRKLMIAAFLLAPGLLLAQTFQWSKSIQSEGFDEGYDLVADSAGNTYVAGQIEFDANFGNGIILSSAGIHDIFLAKYNPNGNLIWAKVAGGKGGDKIQSITLDGLGNLFVVGEFDDTCYWDGIMKVTNGPGVNNMFIAKYDTAGTIAWVRNISVGGFLQTRGYGVTCDEMGNVYACGATKGDTYYDSTFLFTTAGDYDGMLVKFDPLGNFQWARRIGGTDSDKAYGVVSDHNGAVYLTGYFAGTAQFSPTVTLHGNGHTDIFLSKFDVNGTLSWAVQAGDTGFDRAWDITKNVNGQILITGEFQSGHFGNNMAYSKGNLDMFLAAYDSSGNNLWVVSGGGEENDIGRGISHDTSGNVFVIGDYATTGIFGADSVVSNGFADVFIASYTADGSNLNWVRSFGGLGNDRGRGVGTDMTGNINVCGEFVDSCVFDSINLIGDTLLDIFVAKIVPGNFCASQLFVATPINCFGECNATANAVVTGHGPFTYSWSTNPVQSQATASGLCAGSYIVTVTDSRSCQSTAAITITNPIQLLNTVTPTNPKCAGSCDGIALSTATGQGPINYSWLTNPTQSGPLITGLCMGTYTVVATDSLACTDTISFSLVDPLPISISGSVVNTTCIACANGSIDLTVTGGTPAFQYAWSDSMMTQDLQNLISGTYSVCVTDANNCNLCDTFSVVDQPTSVQTILNEPDVMAYPNPIVNVVTVLNTWASTEPIHYTLFTLTGQQLIYEKFKGAEFHINLSDIANGVYMLQLVGEDSQTIRRISLLVNHTR
ncbi:MAG: T9SS type A sorting domain-containing protein [Bacteroidetes bacterium]|nr:T9SS type A sorting domain-containing protein [Bacteroidota bacterium]